MKKRLSIIGLTGAALLCAAAPASAAQNLRIQVDQKGDFVLFGNTLGYECSPAANTPMPIVGDVGACGGETEDTSPDILWRSDSPMDGQAEASTAITPAMARSTAVLQIPAGASITHAFLYWGAKGSAASDNTVTLDRPGAGGFAATAVMAAAADVYTQTQNRYHAVADVTALVQANGPGAYRLSDLNIETLAGVDDSSAVAGWWMVVFYQLATDPPRNLALFDGFDLVSNGNPQTVSISGFTVPAAGFDAKLGVATYEGDNTLTGDQIFFYTGPAMGNPGMPLTDALNPANNFFNSTRSYLGAPVTVVGDLPQLTGEPQSLSGIDLDVIDVKAKLQAGNTSANIRATSSNETYQLAMFVTSIATFKPDFSSSGKTAKDVNGGKLEPGDEIEYTVNITNTGNDASKNTVMTDALPPQVTYVPGSLAVTAGANMGNKSDPPLDDQGEVNLLTQTVTVRLGAGANGLQGGNMAVGESTTVTFRVTLNANATGTIANQAVITAEGEQGAPEEDTPTDGNGNGMGQPPTEVVVGQIDPSEDMDQDGLSDDDEILVGSDPGDADSDDDGVLDGQEKQPGEDTDGDGLVNALDPDSDNDGLFDGTELGKSCSNPATDTSKNHCVADGDLGATVTDPLNKDTDGGGVSDSSEDHNLNGVIDEGETDPTTGHGGDDMVPSNGDTDGDGISDATETTIGTNPMDADSDDDGVPDGLEANPTDDTDGDGTINALDKDSDGDGLFDGTEVGRDCPNPPTDPAANACIPDADMGATKTSPVNPDTDGGGVTDGTEDKNHNGTIDPGETDPTTGHGGDDTTGPQMDTDGDGIPDATETMIGTDPNDADSDDDGVIDGQEPKPGDDTDGDGLVNALDADSDNDGLFDGTELGKDCSNPETDSSVGNCKPDADKGATVTDPLNPDTDGGGVKDGSEDFNLDGAIDAGETDPTEGHGADDATIVDTDGDGLSDKLEEAIGTDPKDADSDDDGVKDGDEPNPASDTDGDGKINALDADSDNDGLFDGTELGLDCSNPATNAEAGTCIPDGDGGKTTTSPLDADTDDGGVKDGDEDGNHNGIVDNDESDPTAGHGDDDRDSSSTGSDGAGGFYASGNGLICAAQPGAGQSGGAASIAGLALAAALAFQRRRRASRSPR